MIKVRILSAIALTVALAACGRSEAPAGEPDNAAAMVRPAAGSPGQLHSASGDVTEVTTKSVTISHGPIASAGWPAMTMTFKASPELAGRVKVGDSVRFAFKEAKGGHILTSIEKS